MSKPESEYKQSPEPLVESDVREPGTQGRRRRSRQPHLETSVNMDELRELIALIQENGFAEFELEREGFRIHVRRDLAGSEAAADSSGAQIADAAPSPRANTAGAGAKGSVDSRTSGSAGRNGGLGRSGSPHDSVSHRRNFLSVGIAE